MLKLVRSIVSALDRRFRSRAVLDLEVFVFCHHLLVFVAGETAPHSAPAPPPANTASCDSEETEAT